jgi:toxin ParE1/3/4
MKKTIVFTDTAKTHLQKIGEYTETTWGLKQSDKYLSQLFDAIDKLPKKPTSTKSRDSLHKGLRSYRVHKHVIFFYENKDQIQIVAILHEKMDPVYHLETDFNV